MQLDEASESSTPRVCLADDRQKLGSMPSSKLNSGRIKALGGSGGSLDEAVGGSSEAAALAEKNAAKEVSRHTRSFQFKIDLLTRHSLDHIWVHAQNDHAQNEPLSPR